MQRRDRPDRHRPLRAAVAAAVVTLALAGCTSSDGELGAEPSAVTVTGLATSSATAPAAPSATASAGVGVGEPGSLSVPDLVAAVQPSVVTVFTGGGSGSGVVYTADGLILTNEHVVSGAQAVEVAFADGQRVAGEVIATDVLTDLALVQADRTGLPAAEFNTDLPRVGEFALVIGSPLGFEGSATTGIISGLHRDIPSSATNSQSLVDLIQTDAAISPGNSGGAVVNAAGQVIGISEAYIPPSAGAVSLGFAIPAGTAVQIADQLREDGTAEHAFVGVVPATLTPEIAQQLGLDADRGVVILETVAGGPAAEAGLEPGDVVIDIDGQPVTTGEDLIGTLRAYSPGDVVVMNVLRDGRPAPVEVTVIDRPAG